jgi:hypothetical protein
MIYLEAIKRVASPYHRIFTHMSKHTRIEIPMNLRVPIAFSPPLPASEAADLVDLLQAKALSQPEA